MYCVHVMYRAHAMFVQCRIILVVCFKAPAGAPPPVCLLYRRLNAGADANFLSCHACSALCQLGAVLPLLMSRCPEYREGDAEMCLVFTECVGAHVTAYFGCAVPSQGCSSISLRIWSAGIPVGSSLLSLSPSHTLHMNNDLRLCASLPAMGLLIFCITSLL